MGLNTLRVALISLFILVSHGDENVDDFRKEVVPRINRTFEEDEGIYFPATTNKNLDPARPDQKDLRQRRVNSTDGMLRRMDVYGVYYQGGKFLSIDASIKKNKDSRTKVKLIRGSTDPRFSHRAKVLTVKNGLLSTIIEAYNNHLNLRIRPDDIWITVLAQLSAYVNGEGRAEVLRDRLVDHDGKKQLKVTAAWGNIYTVDFGVMALDMLDEIAKNIKNETLKEWFLPGFSTSTENDDICAAASAMCVMQEYFEYLFEILCGIPEVTLLGTPEDWALLRGKVDGLLQFEAGDGHLTTWVGLLQRICDQFVESSINGSVNNMVFWDTVAHRSEGGSSEPYLSGWVTTFSYFDDKGEPISLPSGTTEDGAPQWSLSVASGGFLSPQGEKYEKFGDEYSTWPIISTSLLASNVVSCPVQIDDNGEKYDARLFVGQMSLDYLRAGRPMKKRAEALAKEKRGSLRIIQPRNDWAIVIEESEKAE